MEESMATSSGAHGFDWKPSSSTAPFLLQSIDENVDQTTDETPAKRVKKEHACTGTELVTPVSSQSSLPYSDADANTDKTTPSPSVPSQDYHPAPTPSYSPYSRATPMSQDEIRNLLLEEADYNVQTEKKTLKRTSYLSWDDFFMSVALLSAKRSKDPNTPTGACIVDQEYRVIGIGYNGFPRGCSDDALPWTNGTEPLHSPNPFMCHAEVNAILNAVDTVAGARMYVPHFPCNECAKVIVQSRIREVVYMVDRDHDGETFRASRILLTMAGVKMRQYTPSVRRVQLDLSSFVNTKNAPPDEQPTGVDSARDGIVVSDTTDEQVKFRDLLLKEANLDPLATPSSKRTDYLSWDDYFTATSFLTAKRSKDPNTQVGACIVNENKCIVGLGYNGFPRGCSDDHLPWARETTEGSTLHTKYPYVCHAEVNAILNKCSANVQKATLYVALFPCNECAKLIIQSGIEQVVYTSDKYHNTDCCRASRILFEMAGVTLRQHIPRARSICIDFEKARAHGMSDDAGGDE